MRYERFDGIIWGIPFPVQDYNPVIPHFDECFLSCAMQCLVLFIYCKNFCEVFKCSQESNDDIRLSIFCGWNFKSGLFRTSCMLSTNRQHFPIRTIALMWKTWCRPIFPVLVLLHISLFILRHFRVIIILWYPCWSLLSLPLFYSSCNSAVFGVYRCSTLDLK